MTDVIITEQAISVEIVEDALHVSIIEQPINVILTDGISDHGELSGLGDDDHPQYHNNARGDARYYTQAQIATLLAGIS